MCEGLGGGGRATVVAACGTGKTVVGAEVSRRLAPAGRVLVVVPTLDLLAQTAGAYVEWLGAAAGQVVAVCGDAGAAGEVPAVRELLGAGPQVTTDPGLVAALAAGGRVTVACTYASLPVIAAAHRSHGLGPWDLVVVDEAHRSAGHGAKAWAVIHWDAQIPAARRLYLTATPRIMAEAGGQETVSMDDRAVFGPIVHETPFAEAITAGLLADYRVAVAVVTGAEAAKLTAGSAVVSVDGRPLPARMAACQVALARAIRQWDLRRVITYHGRVARAVRFAATLPATLELMSLDERPARSVTADYVTGTMTAAARRQRLAALAEPGNSTAVLCNARVLAEGVDVPELDAIMLADPKDSVTDIVQAIGRALRRGTGPGKIATIIVPVLAADGCDPGQALENTQYATVWRVVRALRAHDERIATWLDARRAQAGRTGDRDPAAGPPPWLHVCGTPVTAAFTAAITVRAVTAATTSWPHWLAALTDYRDAHGHASPPGGYRTSEGLALGDWLRHQRIACRAGHLAPDRAAELDKLGVDWERRHTTWWRNYQHAAAYRAAAGHLDVPGRHTASDGFDLGSWIQTQRKQQRAGTLAPDRAAALDNLGITWDLAGTGWKRGLAHAAAYHAATGHLSIPGGYRTPDGFDLPSWLSDQRTARRAGKLAPDRAAALDNLGITWDRHTSRWQTGLKHLRAFRDTHGHTRVPVSYRPADGFRLYQWLATQRSAYRNGRLTLTRATALLAAGWNPATTPGTTTPAAAPPGTATPPPRPGPATRSASTPPAHQPDQENRDA